MAAAVVSDDLIVEILAKLPVKSLLRFTCACKTWYSIISDPQFSNNLPRMRPCFLLCENLREFSTITTEALLTKKDTTPIPLPLPWETEPDSVITFLGSCNGLVCVDHKISSKRSGLIVWNPSTRKFKRLPYPSSYFLCVWNYVWFGYDEWMDDYKLICLSFNDPDYCPDIAELEVFTLKSNTWERRTVEHIAIWDTNVATLDSRMSDIHREYGLESKSIGVLSNGAIHWIIRGHPPVGGGDFHVIHILAVDLAAEKFRLLKFSHASLGCCPWLGSLGGCLCLCVYGGDHGRDLWVMKEYGVESSWTKLLSITLPCVDSLSFYPFLFSKEEGKEIVALSNFVFFRNDAWDDDASKLSGSIVKLRVEKDANKARLEENLLCVSTDWSHTIQAENNVIILHDLHMEESLVSLSN